MIRLAVVGLGERAAWVLKTMHAADPSVRVAVAVDPSPDRVRERTADAPWGELGDGMEVIGDLDALPGRGVDGVVVGTRCHLHADVAARVASMGCPVFLEKPVAVTADQLARLAAAYAGRLGEDGGVVVSFPLRVSPLFRRALEIVESGRLGAVNQITAVNFVPYGGVYFGQWYRDYDLTGGLWLQKATHDFDYLFALARAAAGGPPVGVAAAETRGYFGGPMPESLRCSACDLADTCPEGPAATAARGDDGGVGVGDHWCAFSRSIRHHDAGSAIVRFASGLHASYSQNFVSRRTAAARGARVTGSLATLEFDWASEVVRVTEHHGTAVDVEHLRTAENHSGGDGALARNFLDVVRGRSPSDTPLAAGLESAALCLAARASAGGDGGFVAAP